MPKIYRQYSIKSVKKGDSAEKDTVYGYIEGAYNY